MVTLYTALPLWKFFKRMLLIQMLLMCHQEHINVLLASIFSLIVSRFNLGCFLGRLDGYCTWKITGLVNVCSTQSDPFVEVTTKRWFWYKCFRFCYENINYFHVFLKIWLTNSLQMVNIVMEYSFHETQASLPEMTSMPFYDFESLGSLC